MSATSTLKYSDVILQYSPQIRTRGPQSCPQRHIYSGGVRATNLADPPSRFMLF